MIATSWGVVWVLAQTVCGPHGHRLAETGSCDACGVETAAVTGEILRMQHSPNWRARDNAAHALRRLDWRCHPEVVAALAFTLLHDPEDEVRAEAAQSLTRMAPCLPVAHEALNRAAARDPSLHARLQARRGLRVLGNRCAGTCQACRPEALVPVIPGTGPGPVEVPPWVPDLAPGGFARPPAGPADPPALDMPGVNAQPLPPLDSRVDPPVELSPLPPPQPFEAGQETKSGKSPAAGETTLARGRTRRAPLGPRLSSILSGRCPERSRARATRHHQPEMKVACDTRPTMSRSPRRGLRSQRPLRRRALSHALEPASAPRPQRIRLLASGA